jgi:hypothetical protein
METATRKKILELLSVCVSFGSFLSGFVDASPAAAAGISCAGNK